MGKAAIDAWQSDKEITPASELDDIFNKRIAEIEAEGPSIDPSSELEDEHEGLDAQAVAIEKAIKDIKQLLLAKHRSYAGAAFKDVVLCGKRIPAEDTILIRISDKIRRLTDGNEYGSEDSLVDMCGYVILLKALKIYKEKK